MKKLQLFFLGLLTSLSCQAYNEIDLKKVKKGGFLVWFVKTVIEAPKADLSGADLSGARLYKAHLTGASLNKAHLKALDMVCADLSKANLTEAHLDSSLLMGANFENADLVFASMEYADLRGTDLRETDLRGATFNPFTLTDKSTNIEGACVVGATGFAEAFKNATGKPLTTLSDCKEAGFNVSFYELDKEQKENLKE